MLTWQRLAVATLAYCVVVVWLRPPPPLLSLPPVCSTPVPAEEQARLAEWSRHLAPLRELALAAATPAGRRLRARPLSGGLSNVNFAAYTEDCASGGAAGAAHLLVREAGDREYLLAGLAAAAGAAVENPFAVAHLIDRATEEWVARTAHEIGVSPRLVGYVPGRGLAATEFVVGRVLSSEEMRSPAVLSEVLGVLGRLHTVPERKLSSYLQARPNAPRYSPLRRCRARHAFLLRNGHAVPDPAALEQLFALLEQSEEALSASFAASQRPVAIVHSDVTPANWLRGSEDGRLWLLDFEYSAFGDPWWDLGSIASLNDFDEAATDLLLSLYHNLQPEGARALASPAALRAHVELMRTLTDLQEAMWGQTQAAISKLPFEADWVGGIDSYASYARLWLQKVQARVADGRVQRWTELVRAQAVAGPLSGAA